MIVAGCESSARFSVSAFELLSSSIAVLMLLGLVAMPCFLAQIDMLSAYVGSSTHWHVLPVYAC
jgi:hypothetical protein